MNDKPGHDRFAIVRTDLVGMFFCGYMHDNGEVLTITPHFSNQFTQAEIFESHAAAQAEIDKWADDMQASYIPLGV